MSRLVELAIASLDDPDAAVVLGDWVLENKWYDVRVTQVVEPNAFRINGNDDVAFQHRLAATGDIRWARGVAAVVLFGDWLDTAYEVRFGGSSNLYHWPVVARCWIYQLTPYQQFSQVISLIEQNIITPEDSIRLLDFPDVQAASSSGSSDPR